MRGLISRFTMRCIVPWSTLIEERFMIIIVIFSLSLKNIIFPINIIPNKCLIFPFEMTVYDIRPRL